MALADPTRRAILARLASGEASVTELAEPFAMTQPAISKHLKVLERAGLISQRSSTPSAARAAWKPSLSPKPRSGLKAIASIGKPPLTAWTPFSKK